MTAPQPVGPPPTRVSARLPRPVQALLPALAVLPGAFAPPNDLLGRDGIGPRWPSGPTAAAALVAVALVALRLRYPRSVAALTIVATALAVRLDGPALSYLVALLVVVFSVARHTDRRTAVVVAVTAAAVVGLAAVTTLQGWGVDRGLLQVSAMVGFAAAAGDAARSRQAYIDTITERARRAEETKESEARRRVAEERLAIARDLHDVVAHQIAVINLHAGVAAAALPDRPQDAERSLATVQGAARTVLSEIGGLLRVLRSTGPASAGQASGLAPVAGLAQLDRLVADVARGGLQVEVRTVGEPVALPPAVDLVAYRVIAEGLTNAQKHGADGSALLQVEYAADVFEATVTNTVVPTREVPSGGGHGLPGARERVAAVGGILQAGLGPGPVHRLVARIPLSPAGPVPADPATVPPPPPQELPT